MTSFNLIPNSYSIEVQFRRDLIKFIVIFSVFVIIILSSIFWLSIDIKNKAAMLKNITDQQFTNQVLSAKIDTLIDKEKQLIRQHQTLNAVNIGLTSNQFLKSIDLALNKDIHFSLFQFLRSEDSNEHIVAKTKLIASAKNHASLADFMDRLSEQRFIASVDLNKSQASQSIKNMVEFELIIAISNDEEIS